MKALMRKFISAVLVLAIITTTSLAGLAESVGGEPKTSGEVFTLAEEVSWAEAGRQIAGMLGYIVEDAADIDLAVYSERIANLSLEDDSIYLAILAEEGYLPEAPAQIDPEAPITAEEYVQLLEIAFPTVVDSQTAVDALTGETDLGNVAIVGDDIVINAMLPGRLAVAEAQQMSLVAVKAPALTLNAASSVDLSESEIERVHISDTSVKEEAQPGEEIEPDVIYLHMDASTQLPEVIVKNADEVIIEGSGALGVVRVQGEVGALTVRATGSVVNETEAVMQVTGPDAQTVELQPGEQTDFVLSKWLVSFVTEGTPVETQEVAPGGMVDFASATTELEGKIFTAWYEDADYTTPVSRLGTVDRQLTLYARFINEDDAAIVTFETFGGRELEQMVFAKGEYLLTKPVESLYTSKEGYSFIGWCVDEECTMAFGYTDPINESITLYAKYSSYEQEVREDPGTVAEVELPNGEAAIGIVLPEGMTAADAVGSITVDAGTGAQIPELAVRETEGGFELYCEAGFIPGTTFTLIAQNGVQFAGYPEYIDTLTVSVFREQVEVVNFNEGLTYVLWDNVTEYTPVSKTDVEYTIDYSEEDAEQDMTEEYDSETDVIPGQLIMTGEVNFQPEQVVVFYDGEINRDEAPIDAWEGGDLAGHVLFAKIESVETGADGTSIVTFYYADPEDYISEMDVHTTEEVDLEESLTEEQIAQAEKSIASQLAENDELKAQMLVAVMTSEDTQRMLDDKFGPGTYSLAALRPIPSDPKLDIKLSVEGSTATAGIGVGITIALYNGGQLLVTVSPYLYFEEQLTIDINVDGGFLWVDLSVLFKTKTTVSLQLTATTGDGMDDVFDEAKTTLEEIVNADGTAVEGYDYQEAADTLMNTMQELIGAELEYQDLFAVPLLKLKYPFYGIITVGVNVELLGQAAVVATFGVTVTAEYGQKIGFNYNFKKMKGSSYKEKLASEVTTEVYLIGKMGVRVGISVTLYLKLLQNVTVSITGAVYAYIELAGMFMYSYALSAGGGNYAGSIYLEVGIDVEIELGLEVEIFILSYEKEWTLWSNRWPLYSWYCSMTMGVVQNNELDEMWKVATDDVNYRTSYAFPYLPMKTYDMYTAECTENQLLFANLQEGNVTAKLTLENIVINGEPVSPDDPRASAIYVGNGENGNYGVVYVDEYAAAANHVELYQCDVVLTYENKNKSELIKMHRQVFPLEREFKIAVTTVNVNIALYDWCAHSWGIEAAEWDNATVFTTSFENPHVLGCPVEPTGTGEIDLDAVIALVQENYPDIDVSTLSWFNPTLNQVDRTVQYSVPRISNMCYLTPESKTVRYDIFATTYTYDLTFRLYANRYPGFTGEITYIIDAPSMPADAVFTVRGSDGGEVMTFTRMEGAANRWSLTASRATFNGTKRNVMVSLSSGEAVDTGLIVTGRESGSEVTLVLDNLSSTLTVEAAEGVEEWNLTSHASGQLSSVKPGEAVTITATLKDGYKRVVAVTDPEGLAYAIDGNAITFTMPLRDVKLTLKGVRSYNASFMYNYGELGEYNVIEVEEGTAIPKPSDPFVSGLTFAGWYDNASCEGEPYDLTKGMNGDVTLYADWRVNVTVDLGGARGQAAANNYGYIFPGDETEYARYTYSTHKLGETALDYKLPNYDGFDFMGWYLTPDFSGESVDPAEYVLTGGVTFYACWNQVAILTYELNYGVQEEPYTMTMEYVGMPLSTIPDAPQRENYNFIGWFRTQDASEANYVKLEDYIAEGSMTLYAGWEPVDYAITYELNGGQSDSEYPDHYNVESGEIVFAKPTRRGYTFLGWTTQDIATADADFSIPTGSSGDIVLTANWEPISYSISYDLIRGATAEANPTEYTVESDAITLVIPEEEGYVFIGWTGTELDGLSTEVVIPAGSIGDRSYTANWSTSIETAEIVKAALDIVPDSYSFKLADFENDIENFNVAAFEEAILDLLAGDDTCAPYIDALTVEVVTGERTAGDDSYTYTAKVVITYTDDGGNEASVTKDNVTLQVNKNAVTISNVEVDYTDAVGGEYIAYGSQLGDVKLSANCKAVNSEGEEIAGVFTWKDTSIVPKNTDNGTAIYTVVFTPDAANAPYYSTAETTVAVNVQAGVQLCIAAPETIEYMGRDLEGSECDFYVIDKDTNARLENSVSITAPVLSQDSYASGTAKVKLTGYDSLTISGISGNSMYYIDAENATDSFIITRAEVKISGKTTYNVEAGSSLNDIELALTASTAYESNVKGTFSWDVTDHDLNSAGSFEYTVKFTPSNVNNYLSSSVKVTVKVSKQQVAVPEIKSVTYDGKTHSANIAETDAYTVTGNDDYTNAGDYEVTLTLKDTSKYEWKDNSGSEPKKLTFTINKATFVVDDSKHTVDMLGYGQKLRAGTETSTNVKEQTTASELIHNVFVKDVNGNTVSGKWVWDEAKTVDALPASKVGDNEDFGDGHSVKATFMPTNSNDQNNYVTLEKEFTVQVERAIPDMETFFGMVAEGDIYQPEGKELNKLKNYTVVVFGKPTNPNNKNIKVEGTADWEEPESYAKAGATNVKFTPKKETINGVTGTNYKGNLVGQVTVGIKHDQEYAITTKDYVDGSSFKDGPACLYEGNSTSGAIKESLAYINHTTPGELTFTVKLGRDGVPYCVRNIYVYRLTLADDFGEPLSQMTYGYGADGQRESQARLRGDVSVDLTVDNYVPGEYGRYTIKFRADPDNIINLVDIQIVLAMGELDDYEKQQQGLTEASSSASSFSLRSMSLAPAMTETVTAAPTMDIVVDATLEPTIEPTVEPTVEPTMDVIVDATLEPTVEPTAEPTVEPTAEPTVEPTAEPTVEPTAEPTVEPTAEPTVEPTAEPTAEQTTEPTAEPTVEPTTEPTVEPTAEPTPEPTDEAAQEQTGTFAIEQAAEPTPVPEPGSIGNLVEIKPDMVLDISGDVWMIPLAEGQKKVKFLWELDKPASQYLVYVQKQDGKAKPELIDQPTKPEIELKVSDYADWRYTLFVGAVLEDGSITWGEAQFELIPYVAPTAEPTPEPTVEPAAKPADEAVQEAQPTENAE